MRCGFVPQGCSGGENRVQSGSRYIVLRHIFRGGYISPAAAGPYMIEPFNSGVSDKGGPARSIRGSRFLPRAALPQLPNRLGRVLLLFSQHAHLLPVVIETFSAFQAHHVHSRAGAALVAPGKGKPAMPAAK